MVATEGNRGSAVTRLSAAEWSARRSVHERRIDARTQGHLARTARGETHP
ncbi:MAG: hypothetical protein JWM88_611, partial [Verrucomicrobia bacterium]|nr:hypothetical protein [Verrucomicrobiota bacterium]